MTPRVGLPLGEAIGAEIAGLGGLPIDVGAGFQAGEPAAAVGVGVDADGVAEVEGLAGFLRGVAADHAAAGLVRGGVGQVLPVEHVIGLIRQGEIGVGVGVDKEVAGGFVVGQGGFEKVPVSLGDVIEGGSIVGGEGLVAAATQPLHQGVAVLACLEHHDFVVAAQGDEVAAGTELDEVVDNAAAVRPAINVIAEGDDGVGGAELEFLVEALEGGGAAVDVSDGEVAHGGRGGKNESSYDEAYCLIEGKFKMPLLSPFELREPQDARDVKLLSDVRDHGWHIVQVLEEPGEPQFAFTVGLYYRFLQPEVLIMGLDPTVSTTVLNEIAGWMLLGRAMRPGRYSDALEGLEMELAPIDLSFYEEYLGYATWFYHSWPQPYPAMQCIWPDKAGRFPGEPGYDERFLALQKLLV